MSDRHSSATGFSDELPVIQTPEEHAAEKELEAASVMPRDIAWSEAPKIIGSGFAMGSADVVPGVSGGTMAVACNIYEQLLEAIASINPKSLRALLTLRVREFLWLVHFRFLLSLGLGLAVAFVIMLKVVRLPHLLVSHPTLVYSVFFGLVFASVFVLGRKIEWNAARWGGLLVGTLLGWLVVSRVPVDLPGGPVYMLGYGAIAISAMLLPGISGSFILLILGQYERVILSLERLMDLDFSALLIVVPFSLGCLLGLAAFSRFVAWLLRFYHDPVVAGLCGLLLGSLWRIWPYQETASREVHGKMKVVEAVPYLPATWEVLPFLLFILGFVGVFLVEYLAGFRRRSTSFPS